MALKGFGKSFVLILIIIILVIGGLLWFDYLGVVHVKSVFAPAYKILKKAPQTSSTATQSRPLVANLDEVLTRQLGIYWNIVSCENDITLGAAISGLIEG